MRLWDFLINKMAKFGDSIAFANLGITYSELCKLQTGTQKRRIRICKGKTKEQQALKILECIANGDVAVPLSNEYGEKRADQISEQLMLDNKTYDDIAFIMFTSGTIKGKKGVMLTDSNIISNIEYISTYFDLNGSESICIFRPLEHISAITGELLYALTQGKKIYFYENAFMPTRLLKYINQYSIDILCITPTLMFNFVGNINENNCALKIISLSGERLTSQNAVLFSKKLPNVKFYNVYGLTEHGPRVSALCPSDFVRKSGSVGHAIGNVKVKIVKGELVVKSPCIMKCYYNKPNNNIIDGWLYTGDLAHFDADGYLFIDGRKDGMLIRAGINIFPQDIEGEALQCEGVNDCVVYGENDNRYGQKICLKYTGNIDELTLRKKLVLKLPTHLIPDEIHRTNKIEYSESGKKQRR